MRSRSPAEIARQSLQILAQRRLPPTPENYQAVYEEVAGLLPQEAFPQRRCATLARCCPPKPPGKNSSLRPFYKPWKPKTGSNCKRPWSSTPSWS